MKNDLFLKELKNLISKHHKEDDLTIEIYCSDNFFWWNGSDFIKEDTDEVQEIDYLIKVGRKEEMKSIEGIVINEIRS